VIRTESIPKAPSMAGASQNPLVDREGHISGACKCALGFTNPPSTGRPWYARELA
jgi:hypothetical protein